MLIAASRNKNVREDIGHDAPTEETGEESSDEEVPFIDQVPIQPAVVNAAVPAGMQTVVTAEQLR